MLFCYYQTFTLPIESVWYLLSRCYLAMIILKAEDKGKLELIYGMFILYISYDNF